MTLVEDRPLAGGHSAARKAMIDSQLRTSGVTAPDVIARMATVAREDFVPASARGIAYIDRAIALGGGRWLAAPLVQGMMLQDVPNAAMVIGYTNASWTLRADLVSEYVCRVLNYMDRKGYKVVIPRDFEDSASEDTVMGALTSGYIQRAADRLPRQGKRAPWVVVQNYLQEIPQLRHRPISDGVLEFDGKPSRQSAVTRMIRPLRAAAGL